MTARASSGANAVCRSLERLGVRHIFGVPGTELLHLFEALRCSGIRTVAGSSELAAAFMANGYARACGAPGVLATISGPGFAYTLPALAEAFFDSTPLVYIAGKPAASHGIDQRAMAEPILKAVYDVDTAEAIQPALERAFVTAGGGEPGPVVVQVAPRVFTDALDLQEREPARSSTTNPAMASSEALDEVCHRLQTSTHPLIYCGQGANGAPQEVEALAEWFHAPVITTRSARGLIPEDHPLAIVFNGDSGCGAALNRWLQKCDLVLALGCKLSQKAAAGLQLPPDKLIHVDAAPHVLNANYPAGVAICADVPRFLAALVQRCKASEARAAGWEQQEILRWQQELHEASAETLVEPRIPELSPPTVPNFFATLRRAMPRNACLVTDSGLHQVLARVHARVFSPRGMIVPTDFQSMGFGLPAAIGAKLAMPDRAVVALVGDGGFAMSALELCSAVREKVALTVIVFNDGALGQIRVQQLAAFGHTHATRLCNPDYALLAQSIGIPCFHLEENADDILTQAIAYPGVSLVEVAVGDSPTVRVRQAEGLAKGTARRLLGPSLLQKLRQKLGARPTAGASFKT